MMKKILTAFSLSILLVICVFCQNQNAHIANSAFRIEGLWHLTGCKSDISSLQYNVQPIFYFANSGIGGRILPMPYNDTIPFKYSVLDSNIVIAFDDSSKQNILSGYTYFSFEIVENRKGVFLKLFSIDRHYTFILAKQDE